MKHGNLPQSLFQSQRRTLPSLDLVHRFPALPIECCLFFIQVYHLTSDAPVATSTLFLRDNAMSWARCNLQQPDYGFNELLRLIEPRPNETRVYSEEVLIVAFLP